MFSNLERCTEQVICSTDEDVLARVKEITNGGLAWGAIDSVAGEMTKNLGRCVRDNGTVFVLGGFSSPECALGVGDLIFRFISFMS